MATTGVQLFGSAKKEIMMNKSLMREVSRLNKVQAAVPAVNLVRFAPDRNLRGASVKRD